MFDDEIDAVVVSVRPREGVLVDVVGGAAGGVRGSIGVRAAVGGGRLISERSGVPGGRRAAGELSGAWSDGGAGAVGSSWCRAHPRLRRHGRVVGDAVLEDRGERVDACRVAHCRGDRRPGVGRHRRRVDRLAGLRRIGIDEISYKRGHRYLTWSSTTTAGVLVWAAPGRDEATLRRFFDDLGPERSAAITHVSADAAEWIAKVVAERCPNAMPLRRPVPRRRLGHRRARRGSPPGLERGPRARRSPAGPGERPGTLERSSTPATRCGRTRRTSPAPSDKLAWIARCDPRLHRAYLLKEGLRLAFQLQRRRRQRSPRPLDRAGPAAAGSRLRRAPTPHRQTPPSDRRRPRLRTVQRADRVDQHQDPAASPASRSGSTDPNPSSLSPCSASAPTPHRLPAEHDPRISQEGSRPGAWCR